MTPADVDVASIPVVILCGGRGVRMGEATNLRPKPLAEVGGRPILHHIMQLYARHGFRRFVLCLGYKGWLVEEYFSDHPPPADWEIVFADTGESAMTGARVQRVSRYLDADCFMLTYGDALADLDLGALLAFHRHHGRIGTVTAVSPPSQFGELVLQGDTVRRFAEKPPRTSSINGGFFVFQRSFVEYLEADPGCVLEREPLERLVRDGELKARVHGGFWQCMDTPKDRELLEGLWRQGRAPWDPHAEPEPPRQLAARAPSDMHVRPLPLSGACVVEFQPVADSRGWFARVFCAETMAAHGLESMYVQQNCSRTHSRGTIRGLHYQLPPYAEAKLIRCTRGAIYDVIVDLREGSPTFLRWHGERLAADNHRMMYVPPGFGHGFLALEDDVEVTYPSSSRYSPRHERGIRYDDPAVGVAWPLAGLQEIVSEKDRSHPLLVVDFKGLRS